MIKYGLINDMAFFRWLEEHMDALLARDAQALSHAIERSCQDKATIVAADERESGQRALLNLGHTFGHAIETGMGYGEWLHGEAVGTGMVLAAELSQRMGWIDAADTERVRALIARAGLPVVAPDRLEAERFLELMAVDKKVQAGRLRLVLMQALGQSVISDDFTAEQLRSTLEHHLATAAERSHA